MKTTPRTTNVDPTPSNPTPGVLHSLLAAGQMPSFPTPRDRQYKVAPRLTLVTFWKVGEVVMSIGRFCTKRKQVRSNLLEPLKQSRHSSFDSFSILLRFSFDQTNLLSYKQCDAIEKDEGALGGWTLLAAPALLQVHNNWRLHINPPRYVTLIPAFACLSLSLSLDWTALRNATWCCFRTCRVA